MILPMLAVFLYIPEQYIPLHLLVTFSPCHPISYDRFYLLHRHREESAGRRRIPCSHSQYCPVFISIRATVMFGIMPSSRMSGDQVASKSQAPRILNFHGQLSDPTFASAAWGASFMVSCIRLQVHRIVHFLT